MRAEKVSVILAVRNGEKWLGAAIESVLNQSHHNWELLIIDNDSSDGTPGIIARYADPRIRQFREANAGVSRARNVGLAAMTGSFFCFLDADDLMLPHSIHSRLEIFRAFPDTDMVDGRVEVMDAQLKRTVRIYTPNFTGDPFDALLAHDDQAFFGQTWLFKREEGMAYAFEPGIHFGEDWLFCLKYGKGRRLRHIKETILIVRRHDQQATRNLRGLEVGYRRISGLLPNFGVPAAQISVYRRKARSIMWKSYLHAGRVSDALRVFFSSFRPLP